MPTIRLLRREDLPFLLNELNLTGEGCEIGVQRGCYSEILLADWLGQKLYSIDSWKHFNEAEYNDITNATDAAHQVCFEETLLRLYPFGLRSVVLRTTSAEASLRFANDSLDFVYLDGNHSFASVSEDISLWYPKLRPGGILAGHDFVPDGDYPKGTFGVTSAVEKFAGANQLPLFRTNEDFFQSWFVQKPTGTGPIVDLGKNTQSYIGARPGHMSRPAPASPVKNTRWQTPPIWERYFRQTSLYRLFWVLRRTYHNLADVPRISRDLAALKLQELTIPLRNAITQSEDPTDYCPTYELSRLGRKLNYRTRIIDKSQPTLVTMVINEPYATLVHRALNSQIKYCEEHNYNFVILREFPSLFSRPISWLKIPLLHQLMAEGYEKLVYFDADVLVTNRKIKLEPFFLRLEASDKHLLLAEDYYAINFGLFFLRNSWQARNLLDLIYGNDADLDHVWWEQNSLIDLLNRIPCLNRLLLVEKQARLFNAMPFGDYHYNVWKPGDFLCHVAGFRELDLGAEIDKVCEASRDYFDHSPYQPAAEPKPLLPSA